MQATTGRQGLGRSTEPDIPGIAGGDVASSRGAERREDFGGSGAAALRTGHLYRWL